MIPADDRMRMGIVGNCLAWQLSNKIAALQLAYSTLLGPRVRFFWPGQHPAEAQKKPNEIQLRKQVPSVPTSLELVCWSVGLLSKRSQLGSGWTGPETPRPELAKKIKQNPN